MFDKSSTLDLAGSIDVPIFLNICKGIIISSLASLNWFLYTNGPQLELKTSTCLGATAKAASLSFSDMRVTELSFAFMLSRGSFRVSRWRRAKDVASGSARACLEKDDPRFK